ncbi:hypothetical protein ACUDA6_12400 [Pseudomonas ceruminis]
MTVTMFLVEARVSASTKVTGVRATVMTLIWPADDIAHQGVLSGQYK